MDLQDKGEVWVVTLRTGATATLLLVRPEISWGG